jgi:hypothetical protein
VVDGYVAAGHDVLVVDSQAPASARPEPKARFPSLTS